MCLNCGVIDQQLSVDGECLQCVEISRHELAVQLTINKKKIQELTARQARLLSSPERNQEGKVPKTPEQVDTEKKEIAENAVHLSYVNLQEMDEKGCYTYTHTNTHKHTHTHTHTHTYTHTERERERERERHTQRETERETHRQRHTDRETHTDTHTEREKFTAVN
jgi:hypothetical protein